MPPRKRVPSPIRTRASHSFSPSSTVPLRIISRQRVTTSCSISECANCKSKGITWRWRIRLTASSSLIGTPNVVAGSLTLMKTFVCLAVARILATADAASPSAHQIFKSLHIESNVALLPRVISAKQSCPRRKGAAFCHSRHAAETKSAGSPEDVTCTLLLQETASRLVSKPSVFPSTNISSISHPRACVCICSCVPIIRIPGMGLPRSIFVSSHPAT